MYLGFAATDYESRGGVSDLVACSRRLAVVQRKVIAAQKISAGIRPATPDEYLTLDEAIERRRYMTSFISITSSSKPGDPLPFGEWTEDGRILVRGAPETPFVSWHTWGQVFNTTTRTMSWLELDDRNKPDFVWEWGKWFPALA